MLGLTLLFVLLLNLAPAAYFGLKGNLRLLERWRQHVILNQEFHEVNGPINLSVKGQARRYLTEIDYTQRVDGDVRYPAVNVASLSTAGISRIWLATSATLFMAGLVLIWRSHAGESKSGLDITGRAVELGLMTCLMLLVGPLTSKIYFIALLWPAVFVAASGVRSVLLLIAIANVVLPLLPGRSVQRLLLVLGADFYVTCLLLGLCAYVILNRRANRSPIGAPQTRVRPATT
jgi:multisubunit Na+/H+ antiporter MnhC subunit